MEKMISLYRDLSIKKTFVLIMLIMVGMTIVMSIITMDILVQVRQSYYRAIGEVGSNYSYVENNQEVEFVITEVESGDILGLLLTYSIFFTPVLWFVICLLGMSRLFYNTKIRKPVQHLMDAAVKIQNKDLDFTVNTHSKDELGQLCVAFESMRYELLEQFKSAWRISEERRKLNRAFAHDVRTPVTIIRGHLQVLRKQILIKEYDQQSVDESIAVSLDNIVRLESYIESLETVSRLSDVVYEPESHQLDQVMEKLMDEVSLCHAKTSITIEHRIDTRDVEVMLDRNLLSRIIHNMVKNAVDHASQSVIVYCKLGHGEIAIDIEDDGNGFSEEALKLAFQPFYTQAIGDSHMGMGLYISDVLCHRMGGRIFIDHNASGGKVCIRIPIADS